MGLGFGRYRLRLRCGALNEGPGSLICWGVGPEKEMTRFGGYGFA